jgi:cytochrome o ubiquinol oxidase operon protein cyoD
MSDHDHDHGHGVALPHASFRGYMTGFVLAVVLTAIPFWLVMGDVLDNKNNTIAIILALGAVQIVVHVIYFLHMDAKAEGGWTLMSFLFTATLILIVLAGSIWIMFHLHENTHPAPTPVEVRNMP